MPKEVRSSTLLRLFQYHLTSKLFQPKAVHMTLFLEQFTGSSLAPPSSQWHCRPVHPRNRWVDQIRNDNNLPTTCGSLEARCQSWSSWSDATASGGSRLGSRGHRPPQILPRPHQIFRVITVHDKLPNTGQLDTVVLLVASQMMRGQARLSDDNNSETTSAPLTDNGWKLSSSIPSDITI